MTRAPAAGWLDCRWSVGEPGVEHRSIAKHVIEHFTRQRRRTVPRAVQTLTERELDLLRLIHQGLSNAEIGEELFISDTTVKTHVTRGLQRVELRDRAQAIVMAYQCQLFESDEVPRG